MAIKNRDNIVLITGGTQGLGFEIAKQLIANGCSELIISGRNKSKGRQAERALSGPGLKIKFLRADLANAKDVKKLIRKSISLCPKLNSLINSAANTTRGKLEETSLELWETHINVNLRAPFLLMRELVRKLKLEKKPGAVVNIASTSSYVGQSFLTAYSTSKGALLTLSKNSANSLRSDKIRVNVIAPGWMNTPGEDRIQRDFHGAGDDWIEKAKKTLPMGDLVQPKHVAILACYLLSPDSGLMTGSVIDHDQQIVGAVPE